MTTLADQITSDLTGFFNEDEFAEAATYTPDGGDATSITISRDDQDPGIMSDAAPGDELIILVRSSQVDPGRGDTFVIAGNTWYLLESLGIVHGVLKLKISRSGTRRV